MLKDWNQAFITEQKECKGMFDNISRDIRKLAKLLFWLGIIFTAGYTIWIWSQGNSRHSTFLLGLIGLAEGLLITVIVSFMMYGFGELIEKTASIEKMLKGIAAEDERQARKQRMLDEGGWKCKCGRINYRYVSTCTCGVSKRDMETKNE